jgi:hemolysin activation/secretion protein
MRAGIRHRPARNSAPALLVVLMLSGAALAATDETGPIEDRLPLRGPQEAAPETPKTSVPDARVTGDIAPFLLRSIEIQGVTAIGADRLEQAVAGHFGTTVGAAELEEMAATLTNVYRGQGYFLSRVVIPPQSINEGHLKFRALEGVVVSAKVAGLSDADAATQFAALLAEQPARLSTFERALLLLSDRYGYAIDKVEIVPVETAPDQFRLSMAASWAPVNVDLFLDNRGTEHKGEEQTFVGTSWNSLVRPGDRLSASIFTSPSNINYTFYGELSYATSWAGGNFWTEGGVSVTSWKDSTTTLPAQFSFESDKVWARVWAPLLRTRETSLWVNLLLEAKENVSDDGTQAPSRERLRVLRGSLSYNEVGDASRTDLTLQTSHGLEVFGASGNSGAGPGQDDARMQFSRVRLTASHFTQLIDTWFVTFQAMGQYADGPLPSGEDFNYGGARFGRGYNYSAISGEHGWSAAAELSYAVNGSFVGLGQMQFFVFADAGRTWRIRPLSQGADTLFASSAGGGLRVSITPQLNASIEAALPIAYDDTVSANDTTRIFFTLSWSQ